MAQRAMPVTRATGKCMLEQLEDTGSPGHETRFHKSP